MSESSSMPFQLIKTGTGTQVQPIPRACPESFRKEERPRVLLTSVRIPDDHIWANGLFQNVYVIYKMMELLGFEPWLLVDNNENNKDAELHKKFRLTDFKTYMQNPFKVIGYIEIAMSCDPSIRKYFRSTGAKICKLYLGNILNIDIETITYYGGMNFSHHVAGELDEIWVSPHYDIHGAYAGSINGLCGKTRIAPYVWDPMFIQDLGHVYNGAQFGINSPRTFVIMEPNISFQKNSFIPIMALEAYYRRHPERVQEVIVINGHKFRDNPYFIQSVAPNLTLIKAGKLQLMPRAHIVNLARAIPHAIILQHQVNNGYNYSFLEWMTMGFPLVHNVPQFKEFGYYYDANDFEAAATQVENIVANHEVNKDSYAAHTRQLTWRFSIYNPENSTVWKRMMLEK